MPLSRRRFLLTSALAAGASTVSTAFAAEKTPQASAPGTHLQDWKAVREQFNLDPKYVHLSLFAIAAHPRPVRRKIEEYRERFDANPFLTIEHELFPENEADYRPTKVCSAIAAYIGGRTEDIALTQNTTTGLSLIYQGLQLKAGDEILTTEHDHYAHHETIRWAVRRCGATCRKISLFDSYDTLSADEMVARVQRAIRPQTRVVGLTWVHSSSGLRLPIRRFADAIAEVNQKRAPDRRVLLVVDGVHGLGVEDPDIVAMGMDAFAAGTHKWMFGPRGTGFVWAKSEVWASMLPISASFSTATLFEAWAQKKAPAEPPKGAWFSPGGFQAYEHFWALPAAFEFHQAIGPKRITERIHQLNAQVREGLAQMKHITLYTPSAPELMAGMVCFDVKGMKPAQVVKHLLEKHRILASTTPYEPPYARVSFGIQNTPEEVEVTLRAIRAMG